MPSFYISSFHFTFFLNVFAQIKKVLSEGIHRNFDVFFFFFFLVYEEREDPNIDANISGPSTGIPCRCWPNIEFWLGSFVIFRVF